MNPGNSAGGWRDFFEVGRRLGLRRNFRGGREWRSVLDRGAGGSGAEHLEETPARKEILLKIAKARHLCNFDEKSLASES